MHRRSYLGAVAAGGLAGLAGCLGVVGLDSHRANPVGVAPDASDDAGYGLADVRELAIEEDVVFVLWSETVTATNYVTQYEKRVTVGPLVDERAAAFVVLSTPQISVLGRQVNPVEDMSTDELVELVVDTYDGVEGAEHVADESWSMLGEAVTVSEFAAEAEFAGDQSVEVALHVTEAVETAEDLVVALGVYPAELGPERENVEALVDAVDETVDVDEDGGDESTDDGGDDGLLGGDEGTENESGSDDGGDDGLLGGDGGSENESESDDDDDGLIETDDG